METETIKKTLMPDWKGTLSAIKIGESKVFNLSYKDATMMRQTASRMKRNGEAEFETKTLTGNKIQFKRIK